MSSTPKPGELPLSRMLNSQPGPLLERGAGRSSRADQAASEPETVLRRFPFQSERSRPGMGRVRQARVCPLLDTYAWFEVSTLKVFGGDYEPRDLSSQAELPIPLARHERRADRASAAFCAVQKTGSNEILEKSGAAPRPIIPVVRVAYPLIAPRTGFHRQGYEWN